MGGFLDPQKRKVLWAEGGGVPQLPCGWWGSWAAVSSWCGMAESIFSSPLWRDPQSTC